VASGAISGFDTDPDLVFAALPERDATARVAFAAGMVSTTIDADAKRLAAAGFVLAVAAEFADFRGLTHALAALDLAGRAAWPACSRPEDQARLDAALVVVPLLDASLSTDDTAVAAAATRLAGALSGPLAITPDERMLLWKSLFDYRAQRMDTTGLVSIASQAQDFMRITSVGAPAQARWWLLLARNHEYFGASDAAADALARARRLADAHRLESVRYELLCVEMTAALKSEAWSRADAIARGIEQALPDVRAGRLPAGLRAQAWWLLWRGEPGAALLRLDRVLAICHDVEVPLRDRGAYEVLRAYALMALGRFADATDTLSAQRELQLGDQGGVLEVLIGLAAGLGAWHTSPQCNEAPAQAKAQICAAMRRASALQFERFLLPLPALASQVAEVALEADVEPEFIARVVRARRLTPADPTRPDWPWRLHVRVLGPLQVLRDGQPLTFSGKLPKKPLELLALLAAHAPQPVPIEAVMDAMWQSSDAEAPKASLEVALNRLRKLLDVPGAVVLADGGLRLDSRMVWSDAAAFQGLEHRWVSGSTEAHRAAQAPRDFASARRAVHLIRGPLLAGELLTAAPWQLLREQFVRRGARLVTGWGAELETQGRWREAADVYEQGLAGNVLAEPLYRALMRVQLQLGERAEVLRTFGRCRDLLASVLGVAPAPETLALRARAADSA